MSYITSLKQILKTEFKEKRLVFDGTDKPKNGAPDPAQGAAVKPADAPKSTDAPKPPNIAPSATDQIDAVTAGKAAAGVDVKHETGAALVVAATSQAETRLREYMGTNMDQLVDMLTLKGNTFTGKVPTNLDFDSLKGSLRDNIVGALKKLEVERFNGVLEKVVPSGEINTLVAKLFPEAFAGYLLAKIKQTFEATKYATYFTKFMEKNPTGYEMKYQLDFDDARRCNVTFPTTPPTFEVDYDKFVGGLSEEEKAEAAKAAEVKKNQESPGRERRVEALEKSWMGGLLKTLGFVEEGKFGDVVDGSNWFAALLVGLFGGASLLNDGGAAYTDMVSNLDPKYKGMLEDIGKRAKGSPFGLEKTAKKVEAEVKGDTETATASAEKYNVMGENEFGSLVEEIAKGAKELPANGVKLKQDYRVPDGKVLSVDLSAANTKITVPKGSTLHIKDGNGRAVGQDKPIETGKITVVAAGPGKKAVIPKDTIFQGKPKFELAAA